MIIRRRSVRVEIEHKTQRVEFFAPPSPSAPATSAPAPEAAPRALLPPETPQTSAARFLEEAIRDPKLSPTHPQEIL